MPTSEFVVAQVEDLMRKGVERVKAGEHFPLTDLRKMDWLVEGVVGQPK